MKSIKLILLFFFLSLFVTSVQAQSTLSDIVRDTIVRVDKGLFKPFLLDGKPISTEVMKWFMQDNQMAYRKIKTVKKLETFSTVTYSIGFTYITLDLLTQQSNELDWVFAKAGGVCVGIGLLTKLLANKQKKKAIRYYNDGVVKTYHEKNMGIQLKGKNNGMGLVLNF